MARDSGDKRLLLGGDRHRQTSGRRRAATSFWPQWILKQLALEWSHTAAACLRPDLGTNSQAHSALHQHSQRRSLTRTVSCEIRIVKRVGLLLAAAAVIVTAVMLLGVARPIPTVSWQTFEQQFSGVAQQAGLRTQGSRTEASDQVQLPLGFRIRQSPTRQSQPRLVFGFPESVQHYTLECVQGGARIDCLVRYTRGMVARVVLRYPSAAASEAAKLGEALRQLSGGMVVRLYENTSS